MSLEWIVILFSVFGHLLNIGHIYGIHLEIVFLKGISVISMSKSAVLQLSVKTF